MKKHFLIIILFQYFLLFCAEQQVHAQNPLVKQWDKRFGGTYHDALYSFQQTGDGGYILGGESYSDSSGDKTENNRDASLQSADYWIVKIDSAGNKQWDKRFGGTNDDYLLSVRQTMDGGYILGGASNSDSSGDKTQDAWGIYDYWIVKTDSSGNKQWDKRFGGASNEELYSLQQTTDGGYILGGYSYSDSSGDKTQHSQGQDDYWMVKVDSLGNKQWDKRFGGSGYDEAYTIQQTKDGGYIIGGYTTTGNNGDVTQPLWGGWDYWIVKTNAAGIKQWDKRFGGTDDDVLYDLRQSMDGSYILAGCSKSDSSGDKSQNNWDSSMSTLDFWILKIDSSGTKQWDKTFGGTADEDFVGSISLTVDGGYLLAGTSYSPISGNKTEDNLGGEQTWIIKTDSIGNIQWDKTIFTDGHDESGYAIESNDRCYLSAGATNGGIGGYKSQLNWDASNSTYDFWIVKFCDSTLNTFAAQLPGFRDSFSIYPNPAHELLFIHSPISGNLKTEIIIYDIAGKEVFQQKNSFRKSDVKINISTLSSGMYFIKVGNELRKFVKQ